MSNSSVFAHRNARIVYAISALQNASAILPVWLIFFTRQLELSVTAATVLGLSRWFALAICNIPTGAWSDRFGRVRVFAIGQLGFALSFVPCALVR